MQRIEIVEGITKSLKGYPDILLGFVFGSVLSDRTFKENSDIDIGIAGKEMFSVDFLLKLNLELSRKFSREFDIVDVNKASGVILQQVLCAGSLIVNKSPELYARIIKKMWYDQADIMPNTRFILKYRRDKFLSKRI